MFEEQMKMLEENRKSFRQIKEPSKDDTRQYITNQENILSALFSIVIDDVFCTSKEKTKEESVNEEIVEEVSNIANMEDYSDDLEIRDILKSELDSWGLKESYTGYKYLLAVEQIAYKYTGNITDDEYDIICNDIGSLFGKSGKDVKTALTFIRKKAEFSNTKYLSVLSKMPRAQITNIFILNQFIELCS